MPRTSVATDNFNRASLGSDWSQINVNEGSIEIHSSTVIRGANVLGLSQRQAARWVGSGSFTDNQYSSLKITNIGYWTSNYSIGVMCRASSDTNANRDYYGFDIAADSSGSTYTTTLYKVVNGSVTTLHAATVTWAINDYVSLEVEGTTLRGCKNGSAIGGSFTQTDSALTTGVPGVTGSASSSAEVTGDDWEGGNITASSGSSPIATMNRRAGDWF
jgi:hypothetical protein